MEDKLFEKLDDFNIREIDILLNENINLSIDSVTRKRMEQTIKKKTGFYESKSTFSDILNNFLKEISMKRKLALALSLFLVLGLWGGGYAYAKTPVAYVSVDINPSVEFGVNAFDNVVSVEAYNEDGKKVLEGTNLINTKVDKAVSAIITNAISDGYIKEEDTITNTATDTDATTSAAVEITVSTDKDKVANKLEESLKDAANKVLENSNLEATVETDKVALAKRDEARELGITPGKLNLIQKLQALDPTIKLENYKDSSVKDIQKKARELREANNKDETITDNNTITNSGDGTNINKKALDSTKGNGPISESSGDGKTLISPQEENNNSSTDKGNYGSEKKEENNNSNSKKGDENLSSSQKKNDNNQENVNSSKSGKSSNGNSNSQSNNK